MVGNTIIFPVCNTKLNRGINPGSVAIIISLSGAHGTIVWDTI